MLVVPGTDFAKNGEGRIVDHDAPGGIVGAFVIRAGIEGTDDPSAVQSVVFHGKIPHCAVYVVRRVHVVRRELWLELLCKGFVLLGGFSFDVSPEMRFAFIVAQADALRIVPGQGNVKARGGQLDHLGPQHGFVRVGLAQQVVGVDERAPLVLAQAVDLDAGEVRVPALPRRQDSPVPVDQPPLGVNPRRHDPPELIKAVHQLFELLFRVQLGVMLVGDQLVDLFPDQPYRRFSHVKTSMRFMSARFVRVSRPRPAPRAKSL